MSSSRPIIRSSQTQTGISSNHADHSNMTVIQVARTITGSNEPVSVPVNITPRKQYKRYLRHDVSTPYLANTAARTSPPSVADRTYVRKCREALLKAFRACTDPDFEKLSFLISCTLNCRQQLTTSEMKDAADLFCNAQNESSGPPTQTTRDFELWLRRFESLFKIANSEQVSFSLQGMELLLRTFRIRGIDTSHRTIAMTCLAQVELDEGSHFLEGWQRGRSAFSHYAKQNWQYHHSIAQRTSLYLRFDKMKRRRSRSREAQEISRGPSRGGGPDSENLCLVAGKFEHLALEDGLQDWVLVEQD